MASFAGGIENNQIVFITWVSISGKSEDEANPQSYNALLDTGAQSTMISKKVVDAVGLQAIGHSFITPVTGKPFRTNRYRIRLDIPIRNVEEELSWRGKDIEVSLLPYEPSNYDVLLGMDLISVYHLTIYNNNFILSI